MSLAGYRYYANRRAAIGLAVFLIAAGVARFFGIRGVDLWHYWNRFYFYSQTVEFRARAIALVIFGCGLYWYLTSQSRVPRSSVAEPSDSPLPYTNPRLEASSRTRKMRIEAEKPDSYEALLDRLYSVDAIIFEKIVTFAFAVEGYRTVSSGGSRVDGGIDGFLELDGMPPIPIQCKHYWREYVGVAQIREFVGVMKIGGYTTGVYVTLKGYSADARAVALSQDIELWDVKRLANLLYKNMDQWPDQLKKFLYSKVPYCSKCDSRMRVKLARKGHFKGEEFWGCPNFCAGSILPLSGNGW